ncbi:MAG: PTS sugar transporter subunit IIA [Thermodesulfobacteriota bacterium]
MNLTIEQLAGALELSAATLERWIRQGRIPVRSSGGECVFSRPALEKWAKSHNLPFALSETGSPPAAAETPENLGAAVDRGGVHYNVAGGTAAAVLRSAVARMDFLDAVRKAELHRLLMERENLASTGIGRGVAVPHPRAPMIGAPEQPLVVTCFLDQPVDYGAVDSRPVFVLFVMLNPDVRRHLLLLSRLSFCIRSDDFIRFLQAVPAPEDLRNRIADMERQLDSENP